MISPKTPLREFIFPVLEGMVYEPALEWNPEILQKMVPLIGRQETRDESLKQKEKKEIKKYDKEKRSRKNHAD